MAEKKSYTRIIGIICGGVFLFSFFILDVAKMSAFGLRKSYNGIDIIKSAFDIGKTETTFLGIILIIAVFAAVVSTLLYFKNHNKAPLLGILCFCSLLLTIILIIIKLESLDITKFIGVGTWLSLVSGIGLATAPKLSKLIKIKRETEAPILSNPDQEESTAVDDPSLVAEEEVLFKKLESEPLNVDLLLMRGNVLVRLGKLQKALIEYEKVIKIDENNADAYTSAGNAYLLLHDYNKAAEYFNKSISLGKELDGKIGLLKTLHIQDKVIEAISVGEEIIKIKPDCIDAHRILKNHYLDKDIKDKAIKSLEAILKVVPDDKESINEIALLYENTGNVSKALDCYSKIIKIDPEDQYSQYLIGKISCSEGNYKKAIECLNKITADTESKLKTSVHLLLSFAYASIEDLDASKRELSSVMIWGTDKLSESDQELIININIKIADDFTKKRQN